MPLYRRHVFAEIKPATQTRIDLGFALQDEPFTARLDDVESSLASADLAVSGYVYDVEISTRGTPGPDADRAGNAAKVAHLGLLPQGQPERYERVERMVRQMEDEGFGSCRNYGECEAVCPKEISIKFIGRMNRDYLRATLLEPADRRGTVKTQ